MRQKQINKLLAIRVPKILDNLTKPYHKSNNPNSPFVYTEPATPVPAKPANKEAWVGKSAQKTNTNSQESNK